MPSTSIFERAKACSLVTPAQNENLGTFFQSPFPMLPTLSLPRTALLLYSLSHKYPGPLAFGSLRLVLLCPCLAALQINLLFAANLGISVFWLAARWAKGTWFSSTPQTKFQLSRTRGWKDVDFEKIVFSIAFQINFSMFYGCKLKIFSKTFFLPVSGFPTIHISVLFYSPMYCTRDPL